MDAPLTPPPTKPTGKRHPMAWLIFITPVALVTAMLMLSSESGLVGIGIAFLLCFFLGDVLERWISPQRYRPGFVVLWGFLLALLNFLLFFAGCLIFISVGR